MPLREGINVWRVYLDLFANLTGFVILGGLGLMIMAGGAILRPHKGASVWERKCQGSGPLQELPAFHATLRTSSQPARHTRYDEANCEVQTDYAGLSFPVGSASMADNLAGRLAVVNACSDIISLLRYKNQNQIDGMSLEIVGRSDPSYRNIRSCQSSAASNYRGIQEALSSAKTERAKKALLATLSDFDLENRTRNGADHILCNFPLAVKRATALFDSCFSRVEKLDRASRTLGQSGANASLSEQYLREVAIASQPYGSGAIPPPGCNTKNKVFDPEACYRTASVRVRLPTRPTGS